MAEDNPVNQKVILRDAAAGKLDRSHLAANGREAYSRFREKPFRPDSDGYPDARDGRIGGHPHDPPRGGRPRVGRGTPIIALTAHASDSHRTAVPGARGWTG